MPADWAAKRHPLKENILLDDINYYNIMFYTFYHYNINNTIKWHNINLEAGLGHESWVFLI